MRIDSLLDKREADLPYEIECPALLICGEKDRAGSGIRYTKAWHRQTGIPLEWIKGAGYNSNTDEPDTVNRMIEAFLSKLQDAACCEEAARLNQTVQNDIIRQHSLEQF